MSNSTQSAVESTTSSRVVVTGIGLVTPFAPSREASWNSIRSGDRAVRWLSAGDFDWTPEFPASIRFAGAPHATLVEPECLEPVIQLANSAASEAIQDSGLSADFFFEHGERCGSVVGTSKVGLRSFGRAFRSLKSNAADVALSEFGWDQFVPDAATCTVARKWNLRGPSLCPVAACATGLVSILRGAELIRSGTCDVVLAGSTDASLVPIVLGSFQRLGVMARGFAEPSMACRPFDANRSGFVIGEGAAILVLERLEFAQARNVSAYAELIAGGMANDPSGITQMEPDGASLAWLIGDVLRRSNLTPSEIDYINMHGTATRANDVAETQAVRAAFGSHANRVLCSSIKGAIGHLLGAAGSVETATSLLALRDQIVPPTANLEVTDPLCDLDYVSKVSRSAHLRTIMKLSLGFGGHLAAAVFRSI